MAKKDYSTFIPQVIPKQFSTNVSWETTGLSQGSADMSFGHHNIMYCMFSAQKIEDVYVPLKRRI